MKVPSCDFDEEVFGNAEENFWIKIFVGILVFYQKYDWWMWIVNSSLTLMYGLLSYFLKKNILHKEAFGISIRTNLYKIKVNIFKPNSNTLIDILVVSCNKTSLLNSILWKFQIYNISLTRFIRHFKIRVVQNWSKVHL